MEREPETVELRQPATTLLFPGFIALAGVLLLFSGRMLGMSAMPAWARIGMTAGALLLSTVGFAYFLSFRLYADAEGIRQSSLFHKRAIRWSDVSAYAFGLQADGSGWNSGDSVLRLLDRTGQEQMTVSLSLETANERKRLLAAVQERLEPASDTTVTV